jgi:hypothetical protein
MPAASSTRQTSESVSEDVFQEPLPAEIWNASDAPRVLHALYERVEQSARRNIAWYFREKARKGLLSRALRGCAIVLFVLGGLAPLVHAIVLGNTPAGSSGFNLNQYGYVSLALAAGLLAFDKFFGVSTSYVRYLTTAFALQKSLSAFQLEWVRLVRKAGGLSSSTDPEPLLAHLSAFQGVVDVIVQSETEAWVAEFHANLSELQRAAKAHAEATQPGTVDLTVANTEQVDGEIEVMIDFGRREHTSAARCQIGGVTPGHHSLTARSSIGGKSVSGLTTVVVPSGGTVSATLTLR